MAKLLRVILCVFIGFILGIFFGSLIVALFLGNSHDMAMEVGMTAFFTTGPIGAIIGLIVGIMWKNASGAK